MLPNSSAFTCLISAGLAKRGWTPLNSNVRSLCATGHSGISPGKTSTGPVAHRGLNLDNYDLDEWERTRTFHWTTHLFLDHSLRYATTSSSSACPQYTWNIKAIFSAVTASFSYRVFLLLLNSFSVCLCFDSRPFCKPVGSSDVCVDNEAMSCLLPVL